MHFGHEKNIALICARSGSKGLKNKNILPFAGKPLLAHTIEFALSSNLISDVVVSTDCSNIADIAINCGAMVPFIRPKRLAQDTSPEWSVWRHAVNFLRPNYTNLKNIFILPTTAPLRSHGDLVGAMKLFNQSGCDGVLTGSRASRNPYFNMVRVDEEQRCEVVINGDQSFSHRQNAPTVYDLTTIAYLMKVQHIMEAPRMFCGDIRMYEVPTERAIDIDTKFDFEIAEFLFNRYTR